MINICYNVKFWLQKKKGVSFIRKVNKLLRFLSH
jgi:hypothetical protein